MGSCLSSSVLTGDYELPSPTAKVVSVTGGLHEYNTPVFVSQVLQAEAALSSSSSSSSSSASWFLCNSDLLSYDDYIPALNANAELQANQLYFVLPKSKLQQRLSATDMAAMAVRASVALQNSSKKNRQKKARISPVLLVNQGPHQATTTSHPGPMRKSFALDDDADEKQIKPKAQPAPAAAFSRSGSVRRLQKYSSRRAKLAVRSFKLRLNTIYEGIVL